MKKKKWSQCSWLKPTQSQLALVAPQADIWVQGAPNPPRVRSRESLDHPGRSERPVVLDDIWNAAHEQHLNFLEDSTSGSKVFVTSRFAKLLPGYTEVALGLLSQEEAVALLLGTADITEPTQAQTSACKTMAKMCGK